MIGATVIHMKKNDRNGRQIEPEKEFRMKYVSVALLAVIALCAAAFTYDHFYGGTYSWVVSETGGVLGRGMSYSQCHLGEVPGVIRCIREP